MRATSSLKREDDVSEAVSKVNSLQTDGSPCSLARQFRYQYHLHCSARQMAGLSGFARHLLHQRARLIYQTRQWTMLVDDLKQL